MYFREMKTHPTTNGGRVRLVFCLAVAGACFLSGPAYADGVKSRPTAARTEKKKISKETKVMVTGSNIPQDAKRVRRIPTTTSPLVIIGRSEIERSGESTVAGLLRRLPAVR